MHRSIRVITVSFVAALAACGGERSPAEPVVMVAAAASLAGVLPDLVQAFEAGTGTQLITMIGASGQLAQQIEHGAPVDVFLSADTGRVSQLERSGRIVAGTRAEYALSRLVIFTNAGSTVQRIEDLGRPGIRRIAIAHPDHAPHGHAARQALMRAGIWAAVEAKLIFGENVRQALQFAETGNVDAALAAHALIVPEAGRTIDVADSLYSPLVHELAIVRGRPHEAGARRFADFVLSAEGRAILARHGFGLPARVP